MNIGFYREIIAGICLGSKSLLSSLLSYMSGTDLTERAIEGRITTVPPLEAVPQHLDKQHVSPPDSDQCFIQNHGLASTGEFTGLACAFSFACSLAPGHVIILETFSMCSEYFVIQNEC